MQRTRQKLHCEELQLTKVILAAPSERTSERGIRDEPFIYYPRSAGGRAFERPLTPFAAWISTGDCGRRPQTHLIVAVKEAITLRRLPTPATVASFESLS